MTVNKDIIFYNKQVLYEKTYTRYSQKATLLSNIQVLFEGIRN